jgi:hypothetical protein
LRKKERRILKVPNPNTMLWQLWTCAVLAGASAQDVEQWGQWELNLTGPADGNPFLDVELNATFALQAVAEEAFILPLGDGAPPVPLVAFDFEHGGDAQHVSNTGSSKSSCPTAQMIDASRSVDIPPGSSGHSVDFGTDVTDRHVMELPGNKEPFNGGLAGLSAFTISGWLKVHDSNDMGDGGNRVVNYCNGGGGIDLIWDAGGGGRLKLAVNEWPDGDKPQSSDGSVPPAPEVWPKWRFFAATYDTKASPSSSSVQFYFGTSKDAATLDTGAANAKNYTRGAVRDPKLPLAFGNFGSGFKANDRLFRGVVFQPQIFARVLTAAEVVAVQHRSGCAPDCSTARCGSDGCGGSCGACTGSKVCTNLGGGDKRCQMPSTVVVPGFYDGDGVYRIRFSPPAVGKWTYSTHSTHAALDGKAGSFTVVTTTDPMNHGPVESDRYKLVYADGTPHFSVGTTSYQWSSKSYAMQAETLRTLKVGQGQGQIFNKMRMTVFPKWYGWNHANPVQTGTAYDIIEGSVAANETAWNCVGGQCPSTAGSFDLTRFNVSYWQNYEKLLGSMREMGVVADIIVFHPYDSGHWGFDCMVSGLRV